MTLPKETKLLIKKQCPSYYIIPWTQLLVKLTDTHPNAVK